MPPSFAGFPSETLKFLSALGFHQSKEWFDANRGLYVSAVKEPMAAYVEALSGVCAARKLPLKGDPVRSVFRLNRDVRFSKDKKPYKTNAGCVLTRTGLKGSPGIAYTHIAPDGCFFAGGFYHPEPEQLAEMRRAIAARPAAFVAVEKKLAAAGLELSDDESLTRNPRDFPDADPRVERAIRFKNYVARRPIEPSLIQDGSALVDAAARFVSDLRPLLDFGWRVIG